MKFSWSLKAEDRPFVLVVFCPLVVLCLLVGYQVFQTRLAEAHWIAAVIFLGPLSIPVILYAAGSRSAFTAASAVLIPLEVLAAFLAQYTIIGISSVFIVFLIWANAISAVFQLCKEGTGRLSWWLLGMICLAIVLPQSWLGPRLVRLESEAKSIVAYSYDFKLRTGTFPSNLSGYRWQSPRLQSHFAYFGHDADDKYTYPFKDAPGYDRSDKFSLRYYVGDKNTAYWFSSRKGWFIEDD